MLHVFFYFVLQSLRGEVIVFDGSVLNLLKKTGCFVPCEEIMTGNRKMNELCAFVLKKKWESLELNKQVY